MMCVEDQKDFLCISKTIRELPKVFPEREERDLEFLPFNHDFGGKAEESHAMSSLCELNCILRTHEGPRKFVISETGFNILQLISRNPVFCVYVMKIRNY